jgi:daunorubicin resistance ABC transporter membrane protein
MTGAFYDRRSVAVLWRRDLLVFSRQRSRLIGALATPLLLWLAIGAGIAPSFDLSGSGTGYMEYFFPGVILILLLQVSISATMSVIEDRRQGFLQGVLAGPGSRAALALGKSLGSATVALLHASLFLSLAPLAGFPYLDITWWRLLFVAGLAALTLAALGFALAWALDSIQGYHVVMNLVLLPLWILSGAMFPAGELHPLLALLVRWNPLSYAMSALRRSLYGGTAPESVMPSWAGPTKELLVLFVAATTALSIAAWVAQRRPGSA